MKPNICLVSMLTLMAAAIAMAHELAAADVPPIDLTEWTAQQMRSVGDDPFGKLVTYGYALMVNPMSRRTSTTSSGRRGADTAETLNVRRPM
jgi:hypothetical protein